MHNKTSFLRVLQQDNTVLHQHLSHQTSCIRNIFYTKDLSPQTNFCNTHSKHTVFVSYSSFTTKTFFCSRTLFYITSFLHHRLLHWIFPGSHVMSRCVMSCHVPLCHVMSNVLSCQVLSCYVMSCHSMSCHVTQCHVMSPCFMLCHARPRCVLCRPVSRAVTLCQNISCHVMQCYVRLCFKGL